jgi:Protein of unknown function (DUF2029).
MSWRKKESGNSSSLARALSLALFALALLEALYFVGGLRVAGLFPIIGGDFRALYAAAQAARAHGFGAIYQPERTLPFQETLCRMAGPEAPCVFIPMVFLPAFALLVLPLTFLSPDVAFALWSVASLLLIFLALRPILRPFPSPERRPLLALMLLAYPSFMNLLWGQVNAWLLLGLARFQVDQEARADFRSGLWLGWLLLKPQTLVLLLPGLALAGRWKTLMGFGASAGLILLLSLALSGPSGLREWWGWISGFAAPHPALAPAVVGAETMMNWRALGVWLDGALPDAPLWAGIGIAMALTALPVPIAWRRAREAGEDRSTRLLVGTLTATLTASWHAHAHTAMILMPSLLSAVREGSLPRPLLLTWGLLPATLPFGVILLEAMRVPLPEGGVVSFLAGRLFFALHLILLGWAITPFLQVRRHP